MQPSYSTKNKQQLHITQGSHYIFVVKFKYFQGCVGTLITINIIKPDDIKAYDDDDDVQWFNVHLKSWLEASLA